MLLDGRRIEIAEAAAEREQIVIGEMLTAKQQHRMAIPRLLDLRELRIAQPAQIDVRDFRSASV